MTLRMHPVSPSRWAQLAASRHPIDLTEDETVPARPDKARKLEAEHAQIQAQVDEISTPRVSTNR